MRLARPAALALLGVLSSGAAAQAPDQRAALVSFRDSLSRVTDTMALRRLEATMIDVARVDRDNALLHLRLGFVAYRLGEVGGGKPHYDDAAGEFEWATELRADWPWAWYGLGLAELALGEHEAILIENVRQLLGKDYLSKAANAFARAAEADPSFAAAVIDLANTALTQRINARLGVALAAVRQAASGPAAREPAVQIARGRVEREAGEADSAVAAFTAALAVGSDSGVALLELARSLYYARQPAAGRARYYAGAAAATSAEATRLYREDIGWIATPDELAAFDGLVTPADRAAWLGRFWDRRDADEARTAGERLAEHYRRWFHARRSFRLVTRHRHYDITETYRSTQAEFDDRGVIYLRHGPPDDRAAYLCPPQSPADDGPACATNESWRYRGPQGDLVFHFAARDDVQDYKLVESLVDVLGFQVSVAAQGRADARVADLYATRDAFGEPYSRVARGQGLRSNVLSDERRLGRRAIAVGTTTDSYRHQFDRGLTVWSSDFVVARRDGPEPAQQLVVVFAVPAGRLTPQPGGGGVHYPLRFRLRVTDSAGVSVASLDTLRVFGAARPLAREEYLTGLLTVPVPAGSLAYRLLVATPDGEAGDVVRRDSLDAPPLDGRSPALSDLVLGRSGSGIAWLPPGDTIPLNPLGRYPQGASIEVYYEVHGLAPGREYRTEITMEPAGGPSLFGRIRGLFGGRRAPISLAFDAPATGPVTRVRRTVALGDLGRGAYVLTIRVIDPDGGTSYLRSRRLEVVSAAAS